MVNRPEDQVGGGAGPMSPADDVTFEAHDARLDKELRRFDRVRAGSRGAEFPHDENYTPGYHEGGARFGFFNGKPQAPSPAQPIPPKADDEA
jgi:hypothetical protein